MGGSAVLSPDVLVDSLVTDVIDGLREDLHPQFGVRPYRTYTVRRTWSGSIVGEGTATDVAVELRPQPRVQEKTTWEPGPNGMVRVGEFLLTEVSLSYTYAELTGGAVAANAQWLIRIDEAHGQGNPSRYFTIARPPAVDREKDMGWVLALRPVQVSGCAP